MNKKLFHESTDRLEWNSIGHQTLVSAWRDNLVTQASAPNANTATAGGGAGWIFARHETRFCFKKAVLSPQPGEIPMPFKMKSNQK
ncbi:hypothetical protein [Polaromonas hydrogenivorans]|uniref:Uncharacterized protein n=1 Tax=Polaromonas hydrogenivorans TaxID=335476 RepID=A0AAU7M0D0_9BURK